MSIIKTRLTIYHSTSHTGLSEKYMQKIPLVILLLLTSFASVGALIFAPALPEIARVFHVSMTSAGNLMAVYLVGYTLGQLFYGRAANTWGRKKSLQLGIIISFAGACLGLFANKIVNFDLLLLSRLLNALGASSGLVITMILIHDLFDADMARKVFSKVVLIFAIVPFLATGLSGYLLSYYGWNSINWFLLIYAIGLMIVVSFIPETLAHANRQKFAASQLLNTYWQALKIASYRRLVFIQGVGTNTNYIFNSIAPLIAINLIHMSVAQYSWFSIIPSIGIVLGAWLSNHFAERFSTKVMITYGMCLILFGSLSLLILLAFTLTIPLFLFLPALIIFTGTSILIPNASMGALSKINDHANGAALMNAVTLGMSSVMVTFAGAVLPYHVLSIPFILIGLSIIGLWIVKRVEI
jgi:DHA1 family bicyclomycin/chloramphenicol resistance-like MFS transporter